MPPCNLFATSPKILSLCAFTLASSNRMGPPCSGLCDIDDAIEEPARSQGPFDVAEILADIGAAIEVRERFTSGVGRARPSTHVNATKGAMLHSPS